ncbi:hypothetical protein GGR54DRAFT_620564 [Hypoxylon sp. NC1633]|nr:hypothetical protein GGR54DRAFT_620564 [Hypoxylon sp. NC1633]
MSSSTPTKDFESAEAYGLFAKGLKYIRPMLQITPRYLSQDDLTRLRVKCTEMDINSGTPQDEGLKVLELRSLSDTIAIAEERGVIDQDGIDASRGPSGCGNWHDACSLRDLFLPLFDQTSHAPDLPDKILPQIGPWKPFKEYRGDDYVDESKVRWRVINALDSSDGSTPDTICFIANEETLEHGKIFPHEFWCILRIGAIKLKSKGNENHQIAPVTIVSASGRHARIVQGYVDGPKGYILVRMTGMITFDGDQKQDSAKLMEIARWFLGSPCRVSTKLD